jgi:putative ABC transport system substrate-binding protein
MQRGILFLALALLVFFPFHHGHAQQPTKVAKIGYLSFRSASGPAPGLDAFRRQLRVLGHVEGKNLAFEYRYAEGKPERFPALVEELVRLKVDVLVMPGTPAALAAKNATKTIPIVFVAVADPVPTGLVDSLARPGGNITGLTEIAEVLAGKRLELLKETVPKLSRVAVLWNPRNPANAQQWKESQLAAKKLGLQLHSMEVSNTDEFEGAFKAAAKARSGALAVAQDSLVNSNQQLIVDLALKHRLPALYHVGAFVAGGGLMSYGPDQNETYKRAAVYVDKILKGAKPADLPVEQPKKFEFIINLKAAKQIDLTIPPNVLARADRVIR